MARRDGQSIKGCMPRGGLHRMPPLTRTSGHCTLLSGPGAGTPAANQQQACQPQTAAGHSRPSRLSRPTHHEALVGALDAPHVKAGVGDDAGVGRHKGGGAPDDAAAGRHLRRGEARPARVARCAERACRPRTPQRTLTCPRCRRDVQCRRRHARNAGSALAIPHPPGEPVRPRTPWPPSHPASQGGPSGSPVGLMAQGRRRAASGRGSTERRQAGGEIGGHLGSAGTWSGRPA